MITIIGLQKILTSPKHGLSQPQTHISSIIRVYFDGIVQFWLFLYLFAIYSRHQQYKDVKIQEMLKTNR